MVSSMARGRLKLSLRPRLILTTLDTPDLDTDTPDSDTPDTLDTMAIDWDTTARGLLMLRPIPTCFMEDLVTLDTLDTPDTSDTMAMDSDTSTARGLLMLSLRLRLILTTLDTDTMDLDTP